MSLRCPVDTVLAILRRFPHPADPLDADSAL